MTTDTTQGNSSPDVASLAEEKMSTEEAGTRIYEIGYLIVPTVPEAELPREVTALKDVLGKEQAVLISEEFPKLRQLAYPMQKRDGEGYRRYINGYFGWLKFETSPGGAFRIEQDIRGLPSLLRYLLIKTVREHTLTASRLRADRREHKEAPKGALPSAPVSETELDKSLEKLIAE